MQVLLVSHVVHLLVALPPVGALCRLEVLVPLDKHLGHGLALTLRGREQELLRDRGSDRGVSYDVILLYSQLVWQLGLCSFGLLLLLSFFHHFLSVCVLLHSFSIHQLSLIIV